MEIPMRIKAKPLPFGLALAAQTSAKSLLKLTLIQTSPVPVTLPPAGVARFLEEPNTALSTARKPERVLIYAVDDMPYLTELYVSLLEESGYVVRTFNNRTTALAGMEADGERPALVITDYVGISMPADEFMRTCRAIHPVVRILMVSGLDPTEMLLLRAKPDRFMKKPFTTERFLEQVRATLTD
jgi:response regulator RpfG family c-di-GMP phosphodiesterase